MAKAHPKATDPVKFWNSYEVFLTAEGQIGEANGLYQRVLQVFNSLKERPYRPSSALR